MMSSLQSSPPGDAALPDPWPQCMDRLASEYPLEEVHTWLKPLQASPQSHGLVLFAPNAFVLDEVRARYLPRIRELLNHFAGSPDVDSVVLFNPMVSLLAIATLTVLCLVVGTYLYARSEKNR